MSNSTSKTIHSAMNDLRKGKITPDQFRAIMRASKAQNGSVAHEQAKFVAIAASNR